jgi:hypothetical protein
MQALFIGQTYIDVTFLTDRMPTGDEKHVASAYAVSFGGNAVTAAFCCAKLGAVPDLRTTVADDWLGRMFLDMAARYRIAIHARKVKASSLSFIMPNDGKRAIVRCPGPGERGQPFRRNVHDFRHVRDRGLRLPADETMARLRTIASIQVIGEEGRGIELPGRAPHREIRPLKHLIRQVVAAQYPEGYTIQYCPCGSIQTFERVLVAFRPRCKQPNEFPRRKHSGRAPPHAWCMANQRLLATYRRRVINIYQIAAPAPHGFARSGRRESMPFWHPLIQYRFHSRTKDGSLEAVFGWVARQNISAAGDGANLHQIAPDLLSGIFTHRGDGINGANYIPISFGGTITSQACLHKPYFEKVVAHDYRDGVKRC